MLRRLEGPIWLAVGLVISILSYRTGIGTFTEPGAGFVALATGLFLMVIGAVTCFARGGASGQETGEERSAGARGTFIRRIFRLAYMVALLICYGLLLEPLGYLIATFLLMFGLFFNPEGRRFVFPLCASLASVSVTYTVFEIWLKTRLPRGLFPWW
ncbi:MAG: tripartite tricarboxylate transporter TctB family protein [Thermodesulfobacteriota bacterium]